MPSEPLIGIWWDDGQRIVAISHSRNINSFRGRYVDSNWNHVDKWPEIANQLGKSPNDEYFVVPRGRVLWDTKTNQGLIYHGTNTSPARLKKIAKLFQLEHWTSALDGHYEVGDAADAFFESDDDWGFQESQKYE